MKITKEQLKQLIKEEIMLERAPATVSDIQSLYNIIIALQGRIETLEKKI